MQNSVQKVYDNKNCAVINLLMPLRISKVINLEFAHAKSKCYLKTSIMIIIGEQSSK